LAKNHNTINDVGTPSIHATPYFMFSTLLQRIQQVPYRRGVRDVEQEMNCGDSVTATRRSDARCQRIGIRNDCGAP